MSTTISNEGKWLEVSATTVLWYENIYDFYW